MSDHGAVTPWSSPNANIRADLEAARELLSRPPDPEEQRRAAEMRQAWADALDAYCEREARRTGRDVGDIVWETVGKLGFGL